MIMKWRAIFTLLALLSLASASDLPADHAARMKAGTELFRETIRPAMVENCLKCHGDEKVRGGLDLSSRALLMEGGDSGPAIEIAEPDESYLLILMRHEEEPTMPPKKDQLPDELIDAFRHWIALGAPYDKPLIEKAGDEPQEMKITESDRQFWSFQPLADPEPPATDSDWVHTDIDAFVHARLVENQLSPNAPASDHARIRRAYLDITGLPPTIEQLQAATSMTHEQLVDELLASPHYGERWARHWLDAARFAESHGFEQDYDRKFAYHYRDFVIKALNTDMPWDQFVRWNLAGDEIAPDDPLAMMATGFLGAGVFPTQLTEKEFEIARYDEMDDMAGTTGTAMLGLTIGCARCHDHKFDPISEQDYYRFVSTFTTTIRSEIDIDLDPQAHRQALDSWQKNHDTQVAALAAYQGADYFQTGYQKWLGGDLQAAIPQAPWTLLSAIQATTDSKKTNLELQPDGALLATGANPAKVTYTITGQSHPQQLRHLRIEALTHDSLNRKGPGRAGNGNFALSHLELLVKPKGTDKATALKLVTAAATHEQNDKHLSVVSAIDSNKSGTGWAVDFGGIGKDQAAVYTLDQPYALAAGTEVEVRMAFLNNGQHSMGRFRLSLSGEASPPVAVGNAEDGELKAAVAATQAGAPLTAAQEAKLVALYAKDDEEWQKLQRAVTDSTTKKPQPQMAKVQVTSEGFPPTKHHADGRGFPHFYPETYFLSRGDPNQKGEVAPPGYLQVLMRNGKTDDYWQSSPPADWTRTSYRRTGLAQWITDTEHGAGHLLARVIANRLWHHHFGRGIVATPNDFGLQGELPTHPQLLDYLASRLIDNGWSLKALHRDILLSATWQQSSAPSAEKSKADPLNQWLWRYTPRRLEAEAVRDSILTAAGQLDTKMYGPGTLSESHQRRSLYFMIKRSRLVPMMQIFDQPEPLTSQGSRPSTTIAPQALMLMNNAQVVKWAQSLATAVAVQESPEAIRSIYLRTLSREPSEAELAASLDFVEQQAQSYEGGYAGRYAMADFCQVMFGLNEFIYLP